MLSVEHVVKGFGNVAAVRDVSFSVPAGSTFGLLGPNGAGKTTTMRMILGILAPDGGAVRWNGAPVDARVRREFGYMPEERGLYAKMRVEAQIAYFARLHGLASADAARRARAWIERLGLGAVAERFCGELSKGNQQKVQVACAAVHDPRLLVLDEPFSGLDPQNAAVLLAALREAQARGATLILSSHQLWQLEDLCDAFCIIAGGATRIAGTLAELRADWPTWTVRVAPASEPLRAILAGYGTEIQEQARGTLAYAIPAATDVAAVLQRLAAAAPITLFEPVAPSLEHIYLRAIEAAA